MGETHAIDDGEIGLTAKAPTLAAYTLREAEINGTRIKCAAPRHELTTFIPRQGASWLHVDLPLARSRFLG